FRAGSAVLSRQAKAQLDEFVAKTASAKGYVVEVSGFTSREGTDAYNHNLGKRRAVAVSDYLMDAGKSAPRRIAPPDSGGENNPVASNRTRSRRAQNRRAEIKLMVSRGIAATEPVSTSNQ